MPSESRVYLAGVGVSPSATGKDALKSQVSAATKALLDAGITYDDVTNGVSSKAASSAAEVFKAFEEGGIKIDTVKEGSEVSSSFKLVQDADAQCVLTIIAEKSAMIALVWVSNRFIGTHPYLWDSSVLFQEPEQEKSQQQATDGVKALCQTVWALRAWSESEGGPGKEKSKLSRADTKGIPNAKEMKHRQDGRHRLGYNPAVETKEVSQEDFEAVRASKKRGNGDNYQNLFKRKGGDRAALARL